MTKEADWWLEQKIARHDERNVKLFFQADVKCEVGYSRNLPTMLCYHDSAMIFTALINIQVSTHHKGEIAESAHKAFYLISCQSPRVFIDSNAFACV